MPAHPGRLSSLLPSALLGSYVIALAASGLFAQSPPNLARSRAGDRTEAAPALEAETVISGIVRDATGAVMGGVEVSLVDVRDVGARSPGERQRVRATARSDSAGVYRIVLEQPGAYVLRFHLAGFEDYTTGRMVFALGEHTVVDASMSVARLAQDVAAVAEGAADGEGSGVALATPDLQMLPVGRGSLAAMQLAPGVISGLSRSGEIIGIEGGFQVHGASSAENQYAVDETEVTSRLTGRPRIDLPREFVAGVEAVTESYNAEFSAGAGGFFRTLTKSGGNAFHFDLFLALERADFAASPVPRLTMDASGRRAFYVQDAKTPEQKWEAGGSLGGPIVRDRLWMFVAASPQWQRAGKEYYTSGRSTRIEQRRTDQTMFSKLTVVNWRGVQGMASWLRAASLSHGLLPAYDAGPNSTTLPAAQLAFASGAGFSQRQSVFAASLDLQPSRASTLHVRFSRSWDDYKVVGVPQNRAVQYGRPTSSLSRTLLAAVPEEQRAASFSIGTRVQNTYYDLAAQSSAGADLALLARRLGAHEIRMGVDFSSTVNRVDRRYPAGGYATVFWGASYQSLAAGSACAFPNPPCSGSFGYYEVDDVGVRGSGRLVHRSLYLQDKWEPSSSLTLSAGLRAESETLPSYQRERAQHGPAFSYADELAPRAGAAYAVGRDRRTRLYANWGRFYIPTGFQLARSAFGAEYWHIYYRSLDSPDVSVLAGGAMPGADLWNPAVAGAFRDASPPFANIVRGLKAPFSDAFHIGLQRRFGRDTNVSIAYVQNSLRRALDDLHVLSPAREDIYLYANPGEGQARIMPVSGATRTPEWLCRARLAGDDVVNCLAGFGIPIPKPRRTYRAMELSFEHRGAALLLGANYVWSRLSGNYSGLAATEEIATPAMGVLLAAPQESEGSITRPGGNANRAWDVDEVLFDSRGHYDVAGLLPSDRTHVLKVYGQGAFSWDGEVGVMFLAERGTPLTTYLITSNGAQVFPEGRGDLGRTPPLSQTDLSLAKKFRLGERVSFRIQVEFANVFNQKTARHRFNWLNRGAAEPRPASAVQLTRENLFNGYDTARLLSATADARSGLGARDPRYGMADLFNPGLQGRLRLAFTF